MKNTSIKYVLSKVISCWRVMTTSLLFFSLPRVSCTVLRPYFIVNDFGDLALGSLEPRSMTPNPIAGAKPFLNLQSGSISTWSDYQRNPFHSTPSILQPNFTPDNPLPGLPSLKSDTIALQVFTHRSYYARPGHIFEDSPDDPSPDNEK